ncbi:hypothetical protein DFH09DRAFT_1104343 [Mycena vulgaris]|nr:hypothetical protein DFH09DRAFT_1104343 [Mycena vulgaris]
MPPSPLAPQQEHAPSQHTPPQAPLDHPTPGPTRPPRSLATRARSHQAPSRPRPVSIDNVTVPDVSSAPFKLTSPQPAGGQTPSRSRSVSTTHLSREPVTLERPRASSLTHTSTAPHPPSTHTSPSPAGITAPPTSPQVGLMPPQPPRAGGTRPALPYRMTFFYYAEILALNYGTEPPTLCSPYRPAPPPLLPAAPPLPPVALPLLLPPPAPKPAPARTPAALPAPRLKKKNHQQGQRQGLAQGRTGGSLQQQRGGRPRPKPARKFAGGTRPSAAFVSRTITPQERGLLEDGLNSVALLSAPAQQVPTFYAATTATYSGRSAHYTLLALASAHADASLARARLELEYYSLRLQALREGLPPPPPQMLVTLAPEYLNLFHHALEGLYDGALAARRPPLFDQTVLGQDTAPLDNPHAHYDPLPHPALGTSVLFGSPGPHRRDDHHNDRRDPAPDPYYDRCHADAFAPGHLFRNNICSDIEMDTASQGSAGVDSQGAEGHDADAAGDDLPLEYDDNDLSPPPTMLHTTITSPTTRSVFQILSSIDTDLPLGH